MKFLKTIYYRTYQKILKFFAKFLKFRKPIILSSITDIPLKDVLIVSGPNIYEHGLLDELLTSLKNKNINYTLFTNVVNNPTIANVMDGVNLYVTNNCQYIIAIGGGSVIDCAKLIGAKVTNKSTISQMKGLLKVKKALPPLIVVPTTAGSGSEATIAAVITDHETSVKYAINDPKLIPMYVVFEPSLLISMPSQITSTTGMDALTHALEAYIGKSNTSETKNYAITSISLIFDNLKKSYDNPTNIEFRKNMQLGSYYAGIAFTKAYVGYVHAIAHALGGMYNIAHGAANAIILPLVLEKYNMAIEKKIIYLYNKLHFKKTETYYYQDLIKKINTLNKEMNIVNDFGSLINEEDIIPLSLRAYKEANPLYPVPKIFSIQDFKDIFYILKTTKKTH